MHPEVVVGSSRGRAVAMNIQCGNASLLLLRTAWRNWGMAKTVEAGTAIFHGRVDHVVPFVDSKQLAAISGAMLIEVEMVHRLVDPTP